MGKDAKSPKRREFLKLLGAGGAAVGAAAVAAKPHAAKAAEDGARAGTGYRETAHVKKYYELAKF